MLGGKHPYPLSHPASPLHLTFEDYHFHYSTLGGAALCLEHLPAVRFKPQTGQGYNQLDPLISRLLAEACSLAPSSTFRVFCV